MSRRKEAAAALRLAQEEVRQAMRELARVEAQPEDDFGEGAVLVLETKRKLLSRYGGVVSQPQRRKLTYAFVKVEDRWFPTGQCPTAIDWDKLMELADGGDLWEATHYRRVQ